MLALVVLLFSYTTSYAQVELGLNEEIEFQAGIKTYQVVIPSATAQLIIKNSAGTELARITDEGHLTMSAGINSTTWTADNAAFGTLDADDLVFGSISHATTNDINAIVPGSGVLQIHLNAAIGDPVPVKFLMFQD